LDPIIEALATKNEIIKAGYRLYNNLYSDIWQTRYYIIAFGFGLPLVVGFSYAYMMRLPGVLPIVVWTSIFATVGLFIGAGYYTGTIANAWKIAIPKVYTDQEIDIATYSSYGLYTVSGLLVLLFLFMRKRIQLAMGCVEETSKAMLQMPLILFFPVVQGLGFLVFMICWTIYAVSVASMGEFEYSDFVVKCGWYMLFCFFWTGQFILALGQIVFAMAVSKWYFARDKSTIGSVTVLSSISTSILYHSGTAAFGALIIACIKMIRSCIAYLQRKAEEMNSGIAKCIFCCFQCCFLCLENV
jgi:choline transporter-like protein 2/4/5